MPEPTKYPPSSNMRAIIFLFLFMLFANFVAATEFSSVHLLMACGQYWDQVHAAGQATLDFTTVTCMEDTDEVDDAIDNIIGYSESEERTLLIGNVEPSFEEYFARALSSGVSLFCFEDALNMTKFSIEPDEALMMQFRPDNSLAASKTGAELCRIAGNSHQNIVVLYGPSEALDVRIDVALEQFEASCPDSSFTIKHSLRGDWSIESGYSLLKNIFLIDTTITTVLAASDVQAVGAIQAVDEMYPSDKANKLFISGFDNSVGGKPYLESKRIFSSVDQHTLLPHEGIWKTIHLFKEMLEENPGLNSTTVIQNSLGLDGYKITTDVMLMAADAEGYVTNLLEPVYAETVRAIPNLGTGPTTIYTSLHDVEVGSIDIAGGSFDATFWVKLEWHDTRLTWDSSVYNATLEWESTDIWFPNIFFNNLQSSQSDNFIYMTKATINSEGLVKASIKVTGSFACGMTIAPYPFDMHLCTIEIGVASSPDKVSLADKAGGKLNEIGNPGGFSTEHESSTISTLNSDTSPTSFPINIFSFNCLFVRDPTFVLSVFVLFAWVLNIFAFGQFWMCVHQGRYDRCGLAITTTLTAAVLKFDVTVSQVPTWLELFFGISLGFQFTAFSSSLLVALHPFDKAEAVKRLGNRVIPNTFPNVVMQAFEFLWGGPTVAPIDRLSRRIQVPVFIIINLFLPFYPSSGEMNIAVHPDSGVKCSLFTINLCAACLYFLVSLSHLLTRSRVKINYPENLEENAKFS